MFRRNFVKLETVRISDNCPNTLRFPASGSGSFYSADNSGLLSWIFLGNKIEDAGFNLWQQVAGTHRCGEAVIGHRANS
jgi:hypothetical protein